jgi:hypothetical protein
MSELPSAWRVRWVARGIRPSVGCGVAFFLCSRTGVEPRHLKSEPPLLHGSAGGAVATGCLSRLPVGSRPSLDLFAGHARIVEAPALPTEDHRAGECARRAPRPRPGSGQSCDGNPGPVRAGRRDARALRVGSGRHGRPSGPCAHAQRRRPQDAGTANAVECTWTDDRLAHAVAPNA